MKPDRLVLGFMKAGMAALGLVLMAVFAVIIVAPMMDLQDEADALSLDAPASSVFHNVGNIAVIISGVLVIIFLVAAFSLAVKDR